MRERGLFKSNNKDKMANSKLFGLFIWINDDPICGNVLNLSNIVEPRKGYDEYQVGELVKAKCPSFGIVEAKLGKISDESGKKDMENILKGPGFKDIVTQVNEPKKRKRPLHVNKSYSESSDHEDTGNDEPPPKKVKTKSKKKEMKTAESSARNLIKVDLKKVAEDLVTTELMTVNEKLSKTCEMTSTQEIPDAIIKEKVPDDLDVHVTTKNATEKAPEVITTKLNDGPSAFKVVRPSAVTPLQNTSQIISDAINILNDEEKCNCPCWTLLKKQEEVISTMKNNMDQIFTRLCQTESSLYWAWNNLNNQTCHQNSYGATPKTNSRDDDLDSRKAFTTCNSDNSSNSTATCSSMNQSHSTELETNSTNMSQTNPFAASSELYNGFSRSQLEMKISQDKDFRKGTIRLFRLMFTKGEMTGRSLTGRVSKTGESRPALEDQNKVEALREIIRSKWSIEDVQINTVIRDLLKPSRQK